MRENSLRDYRTDLEKARMQVRELERAVEVYNAIYDRVYQVLTDSDYMAANGLTGKAVSHAITDAFQQWEEDTKV